MTERVQAPGSWRSRQCWADAHRSRLRPQSHSRVHLDLEVSISPTYSFTHYSQKNSQMKRLRHRDAISGVRLSCQIGRSPRGRDREWLYRQRAESSRSAGRFASLIFRSSRSMAGADQRRNHVTPSNMSDKITANVTSVRRLGERIICSSWSSNKVMPITPGLMPITDPKTKSRKGTRAAPAAKFTTE